MRVALVLLGVLLAAEDPRAASTREMADRLATLYAAQDWKTDPGKAAERAAYYREVLARPLDLRTEAQARLDLGENLLVAGASEEAIQALEGLREWGKRQGIVFQPAFDKRVRQALAIAYLRWGEQQNCVAGHNAQSCVYPIQGEGVHKLRAGARGAMREYTALLDKDPNDLAARWLLHIAAMTLGEPVPPRYKMREDFVKSERDIGFFLDVAPRVGLATASHAGGSVAEDFDGDGYFDLAVSSSGPKDQLRYFHNRGDGRFEDQTIAAGLEGITGGLNLIHADFNNDGWPDLLVLRGGWWGKHGKYPPSLLRNNGPNAAGQITFTDVTVAAGLDSLHPTQTAAWADYDNDGQLDLFLGHESSREESHPSQLFHNNGDGTFTDVAPQLGLAQLGYVKGVAWGDYNNDGKPDLYVSSKGEPNHLFRNDGKDANGQWHFTDVTREAGVAEPLHSFATWWFDFDNDGWLDLFVAGYYTETIGDIPAFHLGLPNKAETPRLYRNLGNGKFADVTKAKGLDRVILPMGVGIGDLDNDGWLDVYFGTGAPEYETLLPNRMFRNQTGQRFEDVTVSGGFGQLQKGHAVSFADYDRDGDQDVFEVLGGAYPGDSYFNVLLENPGHQRQWAGLRLEGVRSNRSAIGARLDVELPSGRHIHRVVQPGTSFGDTPLEQHLGLGTETRIARLRILWPSGREERLTDLAAGQVHHIREGQGVVRARRPKSFLFRQSGTAEPHHRTHP